MAHVARKRSLAEALSSSPARRSYALACAAAVTGLAAVLLAASLREHTPVGQALVFAFLVCLAGTLVTATRYVVCTSVALAGLLITLDRLDAMKMQMTNNHLQVSDVLMAGIMLRHLDATFVAQYWSLLGPWLIGAALAVAGLCAALVVEHRFGLLPGQRRRLWPAVLAFLAASAVTAAVLARSAYMEGVAAIHPFHKITEPNGLRVSVAFDSVERLIRVSAQLSREAGSAGAEPSESPARAGGAGATCETCPDIVLVHLESVFDPNLLADYANDPGYLARMAEESPNPARSGYLLVNIIGGGSWVSEFEVLCGTHHRVFEDGGSFPHMYLAGYLRSCFPAHLKRLGYETHAIYTTHPFFAGVGAGFRSYGIDHFESPSSIGAPLAWKDQRDEHFVGAMRRVLERPRTKPRFIFLSTNSNHGPHGDGSPRPRFEGPFDPGRASDPALRDYINRLNDTYTTMLRLEREARASGRRLAILFYGDHQPSFRMTFVRSASRIFGIRPHFVTLYRMVRTYGDPAATQASGPLRIEDVTGEFLDFAGVPNSSAVALSRALTAKACPAGQAHCDGETKRMIRHLLMRGS